MFLIRKRLTDAVGRARRNEEGAALLAVLGFMTVSMLLVTLLSASVVSSIGRSTSVRADVQSQAAAESGIAAARALVDKGSCTSSTIDNSAVGSSPRYKVTISWLAKKSTTWSTTGCPPVSAVQVRYTATGYATSRGVNQSSGDVAYLESVFGAAVPAAGSTIAGSGAAIYSYGNADGNDVGVGYDGLLGSINGTGAVVQIFNGSASCSGALGLSTIAADIQLHNGSYNLNGCTINGNLSVSGAVTVTGSVVTGSTISGRVTANTLSLTGVSKVNGGTTLGSPVNLIGPVVLGLPGVSGTVLTNPAIPAVPDWTDFGYQGAAGWPGYSIATLSSSQCNDSGLSAVLSGLSASAPVVIDAQACTGGLSAISVSLTRDVTLIVPNTVAFTLPTVNIALGSGKFRIIQPDADLSDGKPTCPAGASLSSGTLNLSLVPVLIYTPCTYTDQSLIGVELGQVYAGRVAFNPGLVRSRTFSSVGLPGVDLGTGLSTATGPRQLLTSRNVLTGP